MQRNKYPVVFLQLSPDIVARGGSAELTMSFTNPLDLDLTDCTLMVEGVGVQKSTLLKVE